MAERFELYACGVELANGFGELTDPVEQRRRFEAEMDLKQRLYGERYPLDEDFLAALAHMPPASGIALGFDRLVMLATGAPTIEQVLWAPVPLSAMPRARLTAPAEALAPSRPPSAPRGSNTVLPGLRHGQRPADAPRRQGRAAEGGELVEAAAEHGAAGGVGQELGEVAAAGEAAVDGQALGQGDELGHGGDHLGGAQGDALEQRLAQVAPGGAAGHAEPQGPGAAVPVRAGEAGQGRDEGEPALDRRRLGEGVELGRGPRTGPGGPPTRPPRPAS